MAEHAPGQHANGLASALNNLNRGNSVAEQLTHPAGNGHTPPSADRRRDDQTTPPTPPPDPPPAEHREDVPIDWVWVRAWRQQAATQLSAREAAEADLTDDQRREQGRAIIEDLLQDHSRTQLSTGGTPMSDREHRAYATAVFDALFRLGRLQPLVERDDIENIHINGCDNVRLQKPDGTTEIGAPVADDDAELAEFLNFLASRTGGGGRPFSVSEPELDLTLPGGARLHALNWVSRRPVIDIRLHRLADVTLTDLTELRTVTPQLANFLTAAVRARKTIVVAGEMGAGKTTMLRALAGAMHPEERLVTVETERELHLDELPHRHHDVVSLEARPGSGEYRPDGTRAGAFSEDRLVRASLRMNASRVTVGEVRGPEILPMFKAMEAGSGSFCTIHAEKARSTINRLVTCALDEGIGVNPEYVYRQIADVIDLIVYVRLIDRSFEGGSRRRVVTDVLHVAPGENDRPALSTVFKLGRSGDPAFVGAPEQLLDELTVYGLEPTAFNRVGEP